MKHNPSINRNFIFLSLALALMSQQRSGPCHTLKLGSS